MCQTLRKMNKELQRYMNLTYRSDSQDTPALRGHSSPDHAATLRDPMINLFAQHNISSIFDSGCNDCHWSWLLSHYIKYQGGDISPGLISNAWFKYPDLNVDIHDCTTDPFPEVDCVLSRDVLIHLSLLDQQRFVNNWLNSNVPWLLTTHCSDVPCNDTFEYSNDLFNDAPINWCVAPWNWPAPRAVIAEFNQVKLGRQLALWHRDDIK